MASRVRPRGSVFTVVASAGYIATGCYVVALAAFVAGACSSSSGGGGTPHVDGAPGGGADAGPLDPTFTNVYKTILGSSSCGSSTGTFKSCHGPNPVVSLGGVQTESDLDFSTQASQDYNSLSPKLKQPFFIGDGETSSGAVQGIVVPQGATRMFFGTMDGHEWSNNTGGYTATISQSYIELVQ